MRALLVVAACLVPLAPAPQQGFDGRGMPTKPAPQPIHEVLMQVFDKDFDKKVTTSELDTTLESFAAMSGAFAPPEPGAGPSKMATMVATAKKIAPSIFKLLDSDDSNSLDKAELKMVALAQASFKSGALRNLTRDVFDTIDADSDDVLSAAELEAATDVDGAVLSKVVELVHEAFPMRKDAASLKKLLLEAVEAAGAGMADGMALVDTDGDGAIGRKEAGQAFKAAKTAFLEAVKTLQEMGPMLAMFGGGMGGDPMGGMGGPMGGMGGPMGGGRGRGRGRGGAR